MLDGGRSSLQLHLEAEGGLRGVGEATPLPRWSRESVEEARGALERVDWSGTGIGLEGDLLSQVAALCTPVGPAVPSARFALEVALLDLIGRALGRPIHRLLAPGGPALPVAVSALLDAGPDGDVLEKARAAVARGARTLKWKVGRAGAFEAELATLRGLRAGLESEVALRLDANGGFSDTDVEERLRVLASLAPQIVEEPSPGWLESTFIPPVPLAADESLLRPGGVALVEEAVRGGRCAAVVLKPMLLGGLLRCLALAERVRSLGATVVVTHSFDGPVAMAAAAGLALALGSPQEAAGLWPHAGLAGFGVDPHRASAALPFLDGGWLIPGDRSGLGLEAP